MAIIQAKKQLNQDTYALDIKSPLIAKKAQAGQFIILRIDEYGERIPLTINDCLDENIRIVFQTVGKTTMKLANLQVGDEILDVVGPLGRPTELTGDNIAIVVGGLGCAIGYLSAKQCYNQRKKVDIIAGFRTKELIILAKEMQKVCDNLYICTDDGSYGYPGFVSNQLQSLLTEKNYDLIITIGPLLMMKAVSQVTKEQGVKTLASMNPIMMDGSGMCGCCRLTCDGQMKFACVDGPDFDAAKVDFDELIIRNNFYRPQEQNAKDHYCRLLQERQG